MIVIYIYTYTYRHVSGNHVLDENTYNNVLDFFKNKNNTDFLKDRQPRYTGGRNRVWRIQKNEKYKFRIRKSTKTQPHIERFCRIIKSIAPSVTNPFVMERDSLKEIQELHQQMNFIWK